MHVIKIGDLYLMSDGTFSPRQADALRINRPSLAGDCRCVRLRPHGSMPAGNHDGNGQDNPPAGQ